MLILSLNDLYWGLPAVLRQYIIDEYFSLQILLWEVMNVLDNHKGLMGCYQRTADPKIKECFDIIHLLNPLILEVHWDIFAIIGVKSYQTV